MDEIVGGAVQRTYTYGLQRIDEYQVVNGAWTPSFYGYDGVSSVSNRGHLAPLGLATSMARRPAPALPQSP